MGGKPFISKYQNYILGLAILLSSIAISIRSSDDGARLILRDYPVAIFFMVVISSLLFVLYIQINKRKIDSLTDQIKASNRTSRNEEDPLLNTLTTRQREVYDLIIAGKSNKEITTELFIEQSTLKTHINQIYKKLDIKNRRELRSR